MDASSLTSPGGFWRALEKHKVGEYTRRRLGRDDAFVSWLIQKWAKRWSGGRKVVEQRQGDEAEKRLVASDLRRLPFGLTCEKMVFLKGICIVRCHSAEKHWTAKHWPWTLCENEVVRVILHCTTSGKVPSPVGKSWALNCHIHHVPAGMMITQRGSMVVILAASFQEAKRSNSQTCFARGWSGQHKETTGAHRSPAHRLYACKWM